ncbi:hypothetical protein K443DRAFT_671249 [Laccaria amethystina LaAM-08-1]|uniref:37S ribosomal protein S9, mitochondrial n=1 Tax=Laccaria amethystina LaAM-08-1 TaxID=1095629 RepID=A0A0C9XYA5_9AGAR|nr:hypothetical protein K443DRAFT_671249 [Laccaria amethystina LaAM-08-1]
MNLSLLCSSLKRAYSTARPFVPPSQLYKLNNSATRGSDRPHQQKRRTKLPPASPNFYTARPDFYDAVLNLEKALGDAGSALRSIQLLPLPAFARASLPPLQPVWKTPEEMTYTFKTQMTTTRYRKVTKILNQLNDYHRIANTAGNSDLAGAIYDILEMFESRNKDAYLARGKRKRVILDEYGRSYTVGKRKTSSARVWMIPIQQPSSIPESHGDVSESSPVITTTILVNNLPLNEYFPLPMDRERITRPLKVAGMLGKYNVFSLVRGGGTTGQSGALAHGIAKGIVAHEPDLETMFRRTKLTRRDPRMVERKKTGLAKARKRYTWVKR